MPRRPSRICLFGDTGAGIEQSILERIFEPFFTTRKKVNRAGSGLGLSVVHGIAKSHGGAIDVTTAVGEGTTFRVYFPLLDVAPEGAGSRPGDTAMPRGTERILVVDDEPSQILTARQALQRQGYTVTGAAMRGTKRRRKKREDSASTGSPNRIAGKPSPGR